MSSLPPRSLPECHLKNADRSGSGTARQLSCRNKDECRMAEDPDAGQPREIWVQDLADRNLFHNRSLDLTLPEAALQYRPNPVIKIMYDRAPAHELPFAYFWEAD